MYKEKMNFYRWAVQLLEYDFEVIYCPGDQNEEADSLSR